MAQATTNAAIEAALHALITDEAAKNKLSFSGQVGIYRERAKLLELRETKEVARIGESKQQKARKEAKK